MTGAPLTLIDTWALAAPSDQDPEYTADSYLPRLLALYEYCGKGPTQVAVSGRAAELLILEDCYPLRSSLAPAVFPHRRDVLRLVTWIIERVPKVEDIDGIREILLEGASVTPKAEHDKRSAAFFEHFLELLARAVLSSRREECASSLWLVLTVCTASALVQTEGEVALVDSTITPENEVLGSYAGMVQVVSDPANACKCSNATALWMAGRKKNAIMLAAHQMQSRDAARWPPTVPPFAMLPSFSASAESLGFDTDTAKAQRLLRACAETVLEVSLADVHALRIDRSGGSKTRTRANDGARAMRRDIDRDYHLHYWSSERGPELADVVIHNEFSITE